MSERLGCLTGELVAALQTAVSRQDAAQIDGAIGRFARYLCVMGAPRDSVAALVIRLVDQAVAGGDVTDTAEARQFVSALGDAAIAKGLAAYDISGP